jgi:hypothetical protein
MYSPYVRVATQAFIPCGRHRVLTFEIRPLTSRQRAHTEERRLRDVSAAFVPAAEGAGEYGSTGLGVIAAALALWFSVAARGGPGFSILADQ